MTIPSRNPADDANLTGLLREVLRKQLQNTDDMLPARVVAFDRATNMASVQPLVQLVSTSGERFNRAQLAQIPVLQIGGGNFVLSVNLVPGDLGWIKANDRDISLFIQSYAESPPNTKRMHSFSDAVFIPDVMTGITIAEEDSSNITLQTKDGANRLSVSSTYVKMTSGANFVTVSSSGITSSGSWAHSGTLTNNGINISSTHVHGGVATGGSNTGGPS